MEWAGALNEDLDQGIEHNGQHKACGDGARNGIERIAHCLPPLLFVKGNVEKSRQRRSRHFAVLTYSMYAPRVQMAAALLDGLF